MPRLLSVAERRRMRHAACSSIDCAVSVRKCRSLSLFRAPDQELVGPAVINIVLGTVYSLLSQTGGLGTLSTLIAAATEQLQAALDDDSWGSERLTTLALLTLSSSSQMSATAQFTPGGGFLCF